MRYGVYNKKQNTPYVIVFFNDKGVVATDADGTAATTSDLGLDNTAAEPVIEMAHDEYPEWFFIEMGTVAIDAAQLGSEHQ